MNCEIKLLLINLVIEEAYLEYYCQKQRALMKINEEMRESNKDVLTKQFQRITFEQLTCVFFFFFLYY